MKVDAYKPRFAELFDASQELECLASNFDFIEGPIWHPREKSLIFSDILGNSMYRWTDAGGLNKIRRNSHMANGNTYDRQGRVLTCEHATSRVTRTDFSAGGEMEILATNYQGKGLNSPNDIVCKKDGMIYFSDPAMGRTEAFGVPRLQELSFQAVFRLDPTDLNLIPLVDDFTKPNGLCFSSDEKYLYVNDSAFHHIRLFEVAEDGLLKNGRLWAELNPVGKGVADGMKVDQSGNIYCCGPGGLHLFDADANYLGIIYMPEQTANFTWGGDDLCSLYLTASTSVYRLRTRIPGFSTFPAN
ncbi:MAG: SMP-30/gluconolactonase/LRE family protein [Chloroflexi bacterium]|nr:SMP-30/gluconolactonase/LRE family protein [Chloroflexota bacterium]